MKHIHTTIVRTYLNNRQHNKVTNPTALTVHHSETTLPRETMSQLRTNKCPLLRLYLNKIDEETPITTMPSLPIRTTHNTLVQLHQHKHTTTGHGFADGSRGGGAPAG